MKRNSEIGGLHVNRMSAPGPSVVWFRHGLRIHDNPALLNAIELAEEGGGHLIPVFIFDGESAG